MRKFMCTHTFSGPGFTREQIYQVAQMAQHDPDVRGYRSFFNLSEGKALCVLEARDLESVTAWFQKMGIPYDSVSPVELEGERGMIEEVSEEPAIAGAP